MNDLKDDLKWYYEDYKTREKKNIDFSKDREIIVASKSSEDAKVYDQYITTELQQ
jgi:hypothetical protein